MTFKDFKNLEYPDAIPLEMVLADVLYKRLLDVTDVMCAYSRAVERDRDENKMRFEESCVCLTQHLSGNYTGKERDKLNKRMISILNKSETLPTHIWDEMYGYTEADEKEWADFYRRIYGNI